MLQILEGSIVRGKSGKALEVVAIDGEKVVVKNGDDLLRVDRSAILQVISPAPKAPAPLAVGVTVYYCGEKFLQQYRDIPLVLLEQREGLWICEKPDGYRTTNLSARDLSRSPIDRPRGRQKATSQPVAGDDSVPPIDHLPECIEIGDRLARKTLAQKFYPKTWFPGRHDDRDQILDAISATVTGLSADGYWAITDEGKQYHISEYSIECGDWKKVHQNNHQN
jgi:hypothetical protein